MPRLNNDFDGKMKFVFGLGFVALIVWWILLASFIGYGLFHASEIGEGLMEILNVLRT